MSTYLYLECLDHDPPLQAEDESGQHLYDLRRIRAEIAHRDELVAAHPDGVPMVSGFDDIDGYFQSNSVRFLAAHQKCRIGIRDEYGHEHPTAEPGQGNGDTEIWQPKRGERVTGTTVDGAQVQGELLYEADDMAELRLADGTRKYVLPGVRPAAEAKAPDSAKPEAPSSGGNSPGSLPATSTDQPATQPGYPAAEAKGQDGDGEPRNPRIGERVVGWSETGTYVGKLSYHSHAVAEIEQDDGTTVYVHPESVRRPASSEETNNA